MTLVLLAAFTLSPVGTYEGGTGTGQDHLVVLQGDGTGTWHFHGCFSESNHKIVWRQTPKGIVIAPTGKTKEIPFRGGGYVSGDGKYEIRTFRSDTFLVPQNLLRRFTNDCRRGLVVQAHFGRWPYLHLQPAKERQPARPDRASILAP